MANPSDSIEWVELYNPTDQTVDLSNWKIKDGNSSTNDDLTLTGQITPFSFSTFDHTSGWLNNSGNEIVTLLDNKNQTVDNYQYSGTSKGKTYGRQPDGGEWIAALDPSKDNSNGTSSTPSPAPDPTSTPNPQPTPSPTPTPQSSAATSKSKTSTTSKTPTPSANPSTPQPTTLNIPTTPTNQTSGVKTTYQIASIAGITSSATPSPTISVKSQKQTNYFLWAGIIMIFAGISLVGYIIFRKNANTHIKLRRRY